MKTILIAAAGTSGHIRPAWTLGCEAVHLGYNVVWVGSNKDVWSFNNAWPKLSLDLYGVRGKNILNLFFVFFKIIKSIFLSIFFIRKNKVDLVIVMGGYVSFPVAIAAILCDVNYVVYEQNTVFGLANRMILFAAKQVFCGLPCKTRKNSYLEIMNPLPKDFSVNKNRFRGDKINLLILGGSLGSSFINQKLPEILSLFKNKINIVHVGGKRGCDEAREKYRNLNLDAVCLDYVDSLDLYLKDTDVVIARSGAMTITESVYYAIPSILIPLPNSADNHQFYNAQWFVDMGYGYCVIEDDSFDNNLKNSLNELMNDKIWSGKRELLLNAKNFDSQLFWSTLKGILQNK